MIKIKMALKSIKAFDLMCEIIKTVDSYIKQNRLCSNIKVNKTYINKKVKKGEKINVLFIMQYPEMWNSQKSIYDAMVVDERFNIQILTVPKRIGINSKVKVFYKINEAYEYCCRRGYESINSKVPYGWLDINSLSQDYIILQRPYNDFMPNEYSLYKLSRHSLLCYIPYGFYMNTGVHLKIGFNRSFLNSVYMIFADSYITKDYCVKNSKKLLNKNCRKIYDIGYPRFDLLILRNEVKCLSLPKNVLWLPRWSLDERTDKTSFFDYIDKFIEFFKIRQDVNLIIRPHPLMFDNFIEKGAISKEEIEQLMLHVKKTKNICFDKNADYIDTFHMSDILVADTTALMVEYYVTMKPIINCGRYDNSDAFGQMIIDSVINAYNWEDLELELSLLLTGEDRFFDMRNENVKRILMHEYPVARKIVNEIYKDAVGNFV